MSADLRPVQPLPRSETAIWFDSTRNRVGAAFIVASCLAGAGGGAYGGHELAMQNIKQERLKPYAARTEKVMGTAGIGMVGLLGGLTVGAIGGSLIINRRKESLRPQE